MSRAVYCEIQPLLDSKGGAIKDGDILQCNNYPRWHLEILRVGLFITRVRRLDLGMVFMFMNESIRDLWTIREDVYE